MLDDAANVLPLIVLDTDPAATERHDLSRPRPALSSSGRLGPTTQTAGCLSAFATGAFRSIYARKVLHQEIISIKAPVSPS
jgi:hypothetical protein